MSKNMRAIRQFKIGLKLWSTNIDMLMQAKEMYEKGYVHYIELYVVPDTYIPTIDKWVLCEGEYIIHCAHSGHEFNLANPALRSKNHLKFKEAQEFASRLKSNYIIVHLGTNGTLDESILQLKNLSDKRICIENKPIEGLSGEACVGSVPEDIKRVLKEVDIKNFVLDFGHAIYAANTLTFRTLL
jgi:sugar phosphate isomerase/epimerase